MALSPLPTQPWEWASFKTARVHIDSHIEFEGHRRHETGLLNFSQHHISNARAEGLNSAIQLIKANARGFRNFTNYRAKILFHCGKLNLGWT